DRKIRRHVDDGWIPSISSCEFEGDGLASEDEVASRRDVSELLPDCLIVKWSELLRHENNACTTPLHVMKVIARLLRFANTPGVTVGVPGAIDDNIHVAAKIH